MVGRLETSTAPTSGFCNRRERRGHTDHGEEDGDKRAFIVCSFRSNDIEQERREAEGGRRSRAQRSICHGCDHQIRPAQAGSPIFAQGSLITPSLAKRWLLLRQHRQRRLFVCRHFLSLEAEPTRLDGGRLRSRVPASARQSENVPVSYPRDADVASWRQQKSPFAGLFGSPLTDSNRRPPLPWRFRGGTGGHGRSLATRCSCKSGVCRVSPVPARARECSGRCTRLVPAALRHDGAAVPLAVEQTSTCELGSCLRSFEGILPVAAGVR